MSRLGQNSLLTKQVTMVKSSVWSSGMVFILLELQFIFIITALNFVCQHFFCNGSRVDISIAGGGGGGGGCCWTDDLIVSVGKQANNFKRCFAVN